MRVCYIRSCHTIERHSFHSFQFGRQMLIAWEVSREYYSSDWWRIHITVLIDSYHHERCFPLLNSISSCVHYFFLYLSQIISLDDRLYQTINEYFHRSFIKSLIDWNYRYSQRHFHRIPETSTSWIIEYIGLYQHLLHHSLFQINTKANRTNIFIYFCWYQTKEERKKTEPTKPSHNARYVLFFIRYRPYIRIVGKRKGEKKKVLWIISWKEKEKYIKAVGRHW